MCRLILILMEIHQPDASIAIMSPMASSLISGYGTDMLRLPLRHMDGQTIGSVHLASELPYHFDLKPRVGTELDQLWIDQRTLLRS